MRWILGDLINYCLKLFKERPNILAQYRKKFKYILVDEFQDTNWAQYELVKLLAEPNNNLTVVGDDDQSIYKFRGASISNILTFKKIFKKAAMFCLRKIIGLRKIFWIFPINLSGKIIRTGWKREWALSVPRNCCH